MDTIDNFIKDNQKKIEENFKNLKISNSYLRVFIRLHLPFYSKNQIRETPNEIILDIRSKLIDKLINYTQLYLKTREKILFFDKSKSKIKGKSKLFCVFENKSDIPINFKPVNNHIGKYILEKFHYIGNYRKDTIMNFGLFANNNNFPFCIASISENDREYITIALNKFGVKVKTDEILVMTRAFGFDNIPHNSMSKLFDRIYNFYKKKHYKVIITALNPLLGFSGGIFYGSSYFDFAKSPMEYFYNNEGIYVNRKAIDNSIHFSYQKLETPPILWLVRGLTKNINHFLECNTKNVYQIKKENYANG